MTPLTNAYDDWPYWDEFDDNYDHDEAYFEDEAMTNAEDDLLHFDEWYDDYVHPDYCASDDDAVEYDAISDYYDAMTEAYQLAHVKQLRKRKIYADYCLRLHKNQGRKRRLSKQRRTKIINKLMDDQMTSGDSWVMVEMLLTFNNEFDGTPQCQFQ